MTARATGLFSVLGRMVLVLLLASCGAPDLSREKAAELIGSHETITKIKSKLLLHKGAGQVAKQLEWWEMRGGAPVNLRGSITQEAVSVGWADFGLITLLDMKAPVKVSITVSGITGDKKSSHRGAEFSWRYADVPPLSRWLASEGGTGTAHFQLYDDGWRVQEVKITMSEAAFSLSDKDKGDMDRAVAEAGARRAERAQAAQVAEQAWQKRLMESRTPTREISRHRIESEPPRDSRRLHFLRGWSHEQTEQVFTGSQGAGRAPRV